VENVRANSTPANPAYIDDNTNAEALYRRTFTPMTAAAISESRTICMAHPGRPRNKFFANT